MQQNIKEYIWEFFNIVSELFPQKVVKKLQLLKDDENEDMFFDYMEIIFEIDDTLLEKIEEKYIDNIHALDSIDEKIKNIASLLEVSSYDNYTDKIKYIDIAENFINDIKTDSKDSAILYNNLASLYKNMCKYDKAKPLFEKALNIREEILEESHPDTATSYDDLASLYSYMGEYKKASLLHETSLKIREKVLGDNHTDTASSYDNLALLYKNTGEYEKAKPLYDKALKIREEILGEDHPDTATSYNNLASLYYNTGEYEKAKPLYDKALKIREEILGENHHDTASSYNNLALLYDDMGEYEKAKPLYDKALKIREEILGENHPDTASSYNNLASLYYNTGEYEKAKPLYDKALKISKEILGENHPDTASSYNNLALLYKNTGEYEKAKPLYDKALKIREEILGENHPDTASSYNNLASLYYNTGEYEKAKPLYDKALKIREEILGENHPDTANSYNNLALLYKNTGEYEKAKPLYEKALKGLMSNNTILPSVKIIYNNYKSINGKNNFINLKIGLEPYISNATIKNFKLLKDFQIEFSKNINIIIGENSSGKTSLLQALTLGLVDSTYSVGEGNNPYERFITKDEKESSIELKIDRFDKQIKIAPEKKEVDHDILSPFVLSYGSNIFTNYDNKLSDIVKDMVDAKIDDGFVSSIFKDFDNGFYNPKSILNELHRMKSDKAKELEKIFVDVLHDFQDDFELIYEDDAYFFKNRHTQIVLKLEELSEGYRNNILIISDILLKILGVGKKPESMEGIILIDEFDRHLHPKWQSNIITKLKKNFPKIQFILTTHNPMSTLDREENEITIIKQDGDKLISVKDSGTKYIDVGTVLLKYFGVDSLVGNSMQDDIKEFTNLKMQDDLSDTDKQRLEELEEKYSQSVATNFIYNNAYFRFLKYLKNKATKDFDADELNSMSDEELDALLSDFEESL